ncbi:MAG: hypothetical protein AAGC72_13655 [Planctomycetota bacterium]
MDNQRPHSNIGPSRDMFGGPWLAVIVFMIIAIGLGWGFTQLLKGMTEQTRQALAAETLQHDFDPDTAYRTKRDLVLGYLADGRIVLLPGRDDLPAGTPNKRSAVSIDELRDTPDEYPDLIGILDTGTAVQFVEVIDEPDNPQTRILVMTRLLSGAYARKTPVLGMHLESADSGEGKGPTRYRPRGDLFEIVGAEGAAVQSKAADALQD